MGFFQIGGEEVCSGVSTLRRIAEEKWGKSKLENFVIAPNIKNCFPASWRRIRMQQCKKWRTFWC
jgi:hypothetical protein